MPWRVRKGKGSRPWKIQRKRGGRWQQVGSSTSKQRAHISVSHRRKGSGHK